MRLYLFLSPHDIPPRLKNSSRRLKSRNRGSKTERSIELFFEEKDKRTRRWIGPWSWPPLPLFLVEKHFGKVGRPGTAISTSISILQETGDIARTKYPDTFVSIEKRKEKWTLGWLIFLRDEVYVIDTRISRNRANWIDVVGWIIKVKEGDWNIIAEEERRSVEIFYPSSCIIYSIVGSM